MDRRHFLLGCTATLLTAKSTLSFAARAAVAQTVIPLWPGTPPGGGGPEGPVETSPSGAERHIAVPTLTVLRPGMGNGHVVLIAGGGGYKRIEMAKEAWPAARWLTARGYTAAILRYRLPSEHWGDGNRVALQDALRALQLVKAQATGLTVLGFSAGAHLLGMAISPMGARMGAVTEAQDSAPVQVDGAALIYPVITLEAPYTHTSTHRILLGAHPTAAEEAAWSVQNTVTAASPPFFLVQAEDDPISDPHNTLIMARACQQHHVNVEMIRYPTGGHGFGMGKPGTPTMAWPARYQHWLQSR
ncbi:alpha/beta hydrolase [Pantoea stewartii]|uniref:alpha/beta hydrolase n=1 Tax=Pantoea stewartii TaxID=66269 RepID=UPI00162A4C64|nr:alpha/beta hydrolase [Pantoea stewartii]MBC0852738.1 alpha/beta hydrolase [Pantoea stewartii]